MNPFIKFAILFIVDIYIFWNFGKLFGFLGLGVILYRLLNTLGLIRSPQIYRGAFSEGIVYLKDYQGSYRNPEPYKEVSNLIKNFKLKDFQIIGIFYDKPGDVPEEKLRSSIGIYRKNQGFPDPVSKELESYFQTNNYFNSELPMTSCIYSSWEFSNPFTMIIGISKFYSIMNKNLEDAVFRKMYKIKENPKVTVELYQSESKIEFFIPIVNEDKFFVYKKEDKPKSE